MSVGTVGSSESLRNEMVDKLAADHALQGRTLRQEVEAALRVVPRELYTPGTALEDAYADRAVITKRQGEQAVSSVSAPYLIAEMLGQAADALGSLEGLDVLEIGSGGYNASLLRELTGRSGSVTTVDIDPDVTDRAAACLGAAGYNDVTVVCADAEQPVEPDRKWDLTIVTAGAWDIPPAWREQLTGGGVLVVPLRTYGITQSWALRRSEHVLDSVSHRQCGFVPFQGAGAHEMRYADIADGVHLRLDEGQDPDLAAAGSLLLDWPREQAWAGVSLPPRTVLADLDLWLATRLTRAPGAFLVLTAQEEAVSAGTVTPSWRFGTPAVLRDGTFSYRSDLRWAGRMFDLGAYAHGPEAAAAAGRMAGHMRAWAEAGCPSPVMHVFPARTPDGDLPDGDVLDKRHSRLVLAFPTPEENGTLR
jgi:protein-L-isoaspartate(D-aspartate) O-methyltransferase